MIRSLILVTLLSAATANPVSAQDTPVPAIGWLVENCLEGDSEEDLCKAFRNGIRYQMRQPLVSGPGDFQVRPPGLGLPRAVTIPEAVIVTPPSDPGYIVK